MLQKVDATALCHSCCVNYHGMCTEASKRHRGRSPVANLFGKGLWHASPGKPVHYINCWHASCRAKAGTQQLTLLPAALPNSCTVPSSQWLTFCSSALGNKSRSLCSSAICPLTSSMELRRSFSGRTLSMCSMIGAMAALYLQAGGTTAGPAVGTTVLVKSLKDDKCHTLFLFQKLLDCTAIKVGSVITW